MIADAQIAQMTRIADIKICVNRDICASVV